MSVHYTSLRHLSPFIFMCVVVFFSSSVAIHFRKFLRVTALLVSTIPTNKIINESAWIVCRPVDVWLHDLSALVWMCGASCRVYSIRLGVCACSIGIVCLHTKFRCFCVLRAHTLNWTRTYRERVLYCYRMCSQLLSPISQYSRKENSNNKMITVFIELRTYRYLLNRWQSFNTSFENDMSTSIQYIYIRTSYLPHQWIISVLSRNEL